ncbi:trypsin-like serine peptidase [Thermostaphylospora chromogena]|uniref:trypsin-like serine peptidase n=1 Tax=Thermostaphylospora chromogena TaxID=35622 RepID=UPI001F615F68|nr:peptidase [Thermostaphylospora chromogena]
MPVVTLIAASAALAGGPAYGARQAEPAATAATDRARVADPIRWRGAETSTEQRRIRNYWSAARMESARSMDRLSDWGRRQGIRLNLSLGAPARTGTPTTIAPTMPKAATAGTARVPNSPGLRWIDGGAVVRTVGRVFFTFQGRAASCSGTAVTSANRSVVMTAGHCVQMNGVFHDNWVFVPGYDRGRQPFGTWVATRLITTPQWSVREDINHDVAAAVVAPVNGRRLTEVVGGQGIAFNQPRRQQMYSFGYPAGAPFDGERLIYCSGRAIDDTVSTRDLGLRCNMTGGSSGGPWLLAFNEATGLGVQNSVNSFKYNFAPDFMFGPFFGREAQAVYQAAASIGAT